jgi:hypothetical protein
MPAYPMICPDCGRTDDVVHSMRCNINYVCTCGVLMVRNWLESRFNTNADSYHKAIHSDSLAIAPSQVAEHRQHFPDVEIDNQCRPVFTNYKQHQKYLDKTGFRKKRQKIRRRIFRKATPA